MKVQTKLLLLISLLIISLVGLLYITFSSHLNTVMEEQLGSSALDYAKTIAQLEYVSKGLADKIDYSKMSDYIEGLRVNTRYQYIIVMDMESIQYSYPYNSGVGKIYKNGGAKKVLEEGLSYSSIDHNKLISAIRGFAPVMYNGQQVGAVLVGLLTDQVHKEIAENRKSLEITLVLGLFVGFILAIFLSLNIKKAIFGLEPKEIAILLSERELIFSSIERSIISVDIQGRILLYNKKAAELFQLPDENINTPLEEFNHELSNAFFEIIESGMNCYNEEFIFNKKLHVMMSCCLMHNPNGDVVGLVANVEEMNQVKKLAYELTGYKDIVNSLRAQNHEFMNKLHTISGLVQLEQYDEVLDYIDRLSQVSSEFQHLLLEHIKNKKIAGLLLAKYNKLSEARIEFKLDKMSFIEDLPDSISDEEVCSILGNLIDNSYESLISTKEEVDSFSEEEDQILTKEVDVMILGDLDVLEIYVRNNGPLLTALSQEEPFKRDFTTKKNTGRKRGQGLYIIKQYIEKANGSIYWKNDKGVIWNVKIPK